MARKPTIYDRMNASDLARITRERGLQKPDVLSIIDWADWLAEQDMQTRTAPTQESAQEESYSDLSAKALRAEAESRGIDAKPLRSKTELIDALEAADGLTEDEQVTKHSDADSEETG